MGLPIWGSLLSRIFLSLFSGGDSPEFCPLIFHASNTSQVYTTPCTWTWLPPGNKSRKETQSVVSSSKSFHLLLPSLQHIQIDLFSRVLGRKLDFFLWGNLNITSNRICMIWAHLHFSDMTGRFGFSSRKLS